MRGAIVAAMSRTLFVSAWADREEEEGRNYPGQDLMDVAPATSPEAKEKAERLAASFEQLNGFTLDQLFAHALRADRKQPSEKLAIEFGHYLAMQALGHGVSWFDDHAEFPLRFPHIEFCLDGYGEDDEPDEPDEDDITTSDHHRWYQSGKLYFVGDEEGLKQKMEQDSYFPNVWFISDHGNAHRVSLGGAEPLYRVEALYERAAETLGWTVEQTHGFSLQMLREMVRQKSPKLAHEISRAVESGSHVFRGVEHLGPIQRKKLDKEIERIYYRNAQGVQINVMDIGKIFAAGHEAFEHGKDLEPAVVAAIKLYRAN